MLLVYSLTLIPQHYCKFNLLAPEQQIVAQDFVMSKNLLILVLQNKQENSTIDMAKIQIKSDKLTPFGGIFSIMEQFDKII